MGKIERIFKPIIWAVLIISTIMLLIPAGFWFWDVLVEYIGPKDVTDRKDVVQVFALIVAGVVGFIGAIVGIVNLSVSRRNLQQQFELESQRSQESALQAYFEQMGDLLTVHSLVSTDREDIKRLAEAQTLTVLARLDGPRKRTLVRFLHGAGLINKGQPIVEFSGANLRHAVFRGADLSGTDLSGADFAGADLRGANLSDTDLRDANIRYAAVSEEQLRTCKSLKGTTMPYWLPHRR